jgi:hypothetical protein
MRKLLIMEESTEDMLGGLRRTRQTIQYTILNISKRLCESQRDPCRNWNWTPKRNKSHSNQSSDPQIRGQLNSAIWMGVGLGVGGVWRAHDASECSVKFGLLNRVGLAGVHFQGAGCVGTPVVHIPASVTWLTIPRG